MLSSCSKCSLVLNAAENLQSGAETAELHIINTISQSSPSRWPLCSIHRRFGCLVVLRSGAVDFSESRENSCASPSERSPASHLL